MFTYVLDQSRNQRITALPWLLNPKEKSGLTDSPVLRSFTFSELRGNRNTREPTDWLGNPGTSHGSWYFFSLQQAAAYKHILVFIL